MILTRVRGECWESIVVVALRLCTIRSGGDRGYQMKMFNDKKQFKKALQLFDACRTSDPQAPLSSTMITQALKACTNIRDLQRGISIHQLVPPDKKGDTYILASLIHLYSKSDLTHSFLTLLSCSAMW